MKPFTTSRSSSSCKMYVLQTLSFIALCSISRRISIATVVGDLLHSTVDKFTRHAFLQEDKFITESRRAITPLRSSPENLAERLFRQRHIRQLLIPTSITVDKSRQYIDFTWPAAGVQAVDKANKHFSSSSPPSPLVLEEQQQPIKLKTQREEEEEEPSQSVEAKHKLIVAKQSDTLQEEEQQTKVQEQGESESECNANASCVKVINSTSKSQTTLPLHTRALAEYLRAYTTSSDGTLATQQLIYGRRGITIKDVIPIGNYALRIAFSDGHDGGIYSYEYLYALTVHDGSKYHYMRNYIQSLRKARKSRDPPKRARSLRRFAEQVHSTENTK